MSGICGSVRFRSGSDAPPGDTLDSMLKPAAFRGPDGTGMWHDRDVELGHLALHVTPESVHEPQPLEDPGESLVLVADARLDNREELIRELRPTPRAAREGIGDGRLILEAYRRWGDDCAAKLLGDFAFAVWDRKTRRLFAARDPMGMRGFHYLRVGDRLLFATEAEQILHAPGVPQKLFDPSVGAYLAGAWGPPDWTFYEGIAQLAPGHALLVSDGGLRTWRFWDLDPEARIRYRRDEEYAEHFKILFEDAVRKRLRSRKMVGLMLSGGTDSGCIAAMAGWLLRQGRDVVAPGVRAYSSAFRELEGSDERHISSPMAAHFGMPVTDVPADDAWPLSGFPRWGPHRDEPFIGVYQRLNERRFQAAVGEGSVLVLTGDRGDEVVGDWVYDIPGLLRSGRWWTAYRELRAYSGGICRFWKVELRNPARAALGRDAPPRVRYPPWIASEFAARVGLPDILRQGGPEAPLRGSARRKRYGRIFRPGGHRMALWHDRTAARLGLSWADPWSDRRLAEFVLAIPQHLVNRVSEPKRIAHRAMSPIMPPGLTRSTRKIIPSELFHRGFRERETDTVRQLMTEPVSESLGYLIPSQVLAEYDRYLAGNSVRHDFWWPLTLEAWLRAHW
jgi:asparagine synthase (glutamine-hydrolysing)